MIEAYRGPIDKQWVPEDDQNLSDRFGSVDEQVSVVGRDVAAKVVVVDGD